MMYDGTGTAKSILSWLVQGGYSCVLEVNEKKRRAYLEDEDDERTQVRASIRVARDLISDGDVMPWRVLGGGWVTYRPTRWVQRWYEEHPPKDGAAGVPDEARAYYAYFQQYGSLELEADTLVAESAKMRDLLVRAEPIIRSMRDASCVVLTAAYEAAGAWLQDFPYQRGAPVWALPALEEPCNWCGEPIEAGQERVHFSNGVRHRACDRERARAHDESDRQMYERVAAHLDGDDSQIEYDDE